MSQPSDASNIDYGARATKRFDVWGNGVDFFSYTELARNWDLVDGIVGRPNDNSQWPPSIGIGGGIWAEIQRLEALIEERGTMIGKTGHWFRPSTAVPIAYIQDKGWEICDGQEVTDHDFPNFTDPFFLPNLLNMFIVGADIARPPGSPGTVSAAPGELQTNAGGNVGEAGAHETTHAHSTDNHTHTVANHAHSIALHSHVVPNHRHTLGGVTGGSQASGEFVKRPGTQGVSPVQHAHTLPARTGAVDIGAFSTKLGGPTTTGSAGGQTTSSSGSGNTHNTTLDNRPRHVGLLPIMKVRNP